MKFGPYQYLHSGLSFFGVAINMLLLYLAVTKSPKMMRNCSVLIANKTVTGVFSFLASFFVMQRILVDEDSVIIIPTGPCTYFGEAVCYAGHMFMMCFLEQSMVWILACFLFRYYTLNIRNPSMRTLIFVIASIYVTSFIHMTIWIRMYSEEQSWATSDVLMEANISDSIDSSNETLLAVSPKDNHDDMIITRKAVYWSSVVVFTQLTVLVAVVVSAFFWICNVITSFINNMGLDKNEDVEALNRYLIKILTLEVCISVWALVGVTLVVLAYTGTVRPESVEYAISFSFMLVPIMFPVSYVLFVPSYWEFCMRWGQKCLQFFAGDDDTDRQCEQVN